MNKPKVKKQKPKEPYLRITLNFSPDKQPEMELYFALMELSKNGIANTPTQIKQILANYLFGDDSNRQKGPEKKTISEEKSKIIGSILDMS